MQSSAADGDFVLPHWQILAIEETNKEYRIRAKYLLSTSSCPHCGALSRRVRFGKRLQRFWDLPRQSKWVSFLVLRQRWRCQTCGKTFLNRLPDMDEHHRITKRLLDYIQREMQTRTNVSIAAEVGLSEGSIRNMHRLLEKAAE